MGLLKMNKKNLISTIIAIIVLLVFCIISKQSITLPSLISYVLIYSIAALSLNVICGCLGEFVLGHGGFLLIGYTVASLVSKAIYNNINQAFYEEHIFTVLGAELHLLGYGLITLDVIIAAIVTGLIGFIVGSIALGRLKGDYLAIVTLGISLIFVNVAQNVEVFGKNKSIGAKTYLGGNPLIYGIFFVLVIILILTFMKSRFGRSILSCRDDNIAAEACGVPVNKYKVLAFTFATFIAGIAGGLLSHHAMLVPTDFGLDFSILFLIIIVLGGLGSLTGSVMGSIVIILYNQWFCAQSWVPDFFSSNPKIIYGIILVLIMLFRSSGILGTSEFTWKWFYDKINVIKNKLFKKKQTPKEVE